MKLLKIFCYCLTSLFILNTSYAAPPTTPSEVDLTPSESDANHITYFLLQIDSALSVDVSVDYMTRDDSAIADDDYIATSGVATIYAGETSTVIGVEIIGDSIAENNESFLLAISNPQGASFPEGITEITASKTIIDDDNAANYKIVDTGQSSCYNSSGSNVSCSNSGQDRGAYSGNQPAYTDNGDGTITDNVSGLMWQNSPDTNGDGNINTQDKMEQAAAESYCSNLVLANQSDWRLPDIKTMYSLINFNGEDVSGFTGDDTSGLTPFIDSNYFEFAYGDTSADERIIDVQYATTTIYVSTTMNGDATMFGVNMADGRIKGYGMSVNNSEKTFSVQCVRGDENYATNSFTDNADETISDTATNLMWEKNDSQSPMDWDQAISYCESVATGGYTDWYLPNAKELQGIVDYSRSPDTTSSAAINAVFQSTSFTNEGGATDWGYYWTSTTHLNFNGEGDKAVYISFGRALGYMNGNWLDVHGAGAQRSNFKVSSSSLDPSYGTVTDANGNEAIYHGPQGDVVRTDNYVRYDVCEQIKILPA